MPGDPKACWKIRYDSRGEAQAAIAKLRSNKRDERGPKATAYRCDFCGGWHWGHEVKRYVKPRRPARAVAWECEE